MRSNPNLYPAGSRPRFNRSHIVARDVFLSAVAVGGNLTNLITGKSATITGSPTSGFDGRLGPYVLPVADTGYYQFTGLPTNTPTGYTYACIIASPAAWTNFTSLIESAFGDWPQFFIDTAGLFGFFTVGGKSFMSAPSTGGVPLFVAMSDDGTNSRCVVKNLLTGAIQTSTTTSDGMIAWGGTITVGGQAGGTGQGVNTAAVMARNRATSLQHLLQWAKAPWDLWYPPQQANRGVAASGAINVNLTGVNATAAAGTPTVTGIGNVTLTGVNATAAAGTATVSGKANFTLTGVSATTAVNVPTITAAANLTPTGVVGTTAVNVPTVTGFANVTLSGVNATGQAGDVTVSVGGAINVTLTGVAATAAVGTPTITGFANVTLTGIAASAQIGTLTTSAAANVSLTGVAATSAVNAPTVTGLANVTLSGVNASAQAGDVTVSVPTAVSVTLTGVSSVAFVGTLTTNLDQANTDGQTVLTNRGAGRAFTRKRYEEFLEAERAIAAAEERAARLKAKPKAALTKAVKVAEEAIELASPRLEALTEAIKAATAAREYAEIIARANEAARIAAEMIEQEEEELIMMLVA